MVEQHSCFVLYEFVGHIMHVSPCCLSFVVGQVSGVRSDLSFLRLLAGIQHGKRRKVEYADRDLFDGLYDIQAEVRENRTM
jgi:hypothetical protein